VSTTLQIAFTALGIWAVVLAIGEVPAPGQSFGLILAFAAGIALSLLFRRDPPTPPTPPLPPLPQNVTPSGIQFAWDACVRLVDGQLNYIERLDIKLGIVIAGLVSAAGIFMDRAHGLFAMILGCASLGPLIVAATGFLIGCYEDAPDPRVAVDAARSDASTAKLELIGNFITSFERNQTVIFRKGRCLNVAAVAISAIVLVAMLGKAYGEIQWHHANAVKLTTPSSPTAFKRSKPDRSPLSWIGHPSTDKN
jgi:hypothetical protein